MRFSALSPIPRDEHRKTGCEEEHGGWQAKELSRFPECAEFQRSHAPLAHVYLYGRALKWIRRARFELTEKKRLQEKPLLTPISFSLMS